MELRQLQYFTCLYEEGSMTRAARRLNIVQPALSMQIAKLEDEIGQKLFERSSKGMKPTEAGHDAYRLFLPILRDIVDARQQIAERSSKVIGQISVGMITSVTTSVLAATIADFTELYPEVTVSATGGYTPDLVQMVRTGMLDFAIVNRGRRKLDLPSIDIFDEELTLVSAKSTIIPVPTPITFRDVNKLKLVVPSKRHGLRTLIDAAAENEDFDLTPRIEIDELSAIEELVGSTDWVTILPAIAIHKGLKDGTLRAHLIVAPRVTRRVVAVHSNHRPLTPAARLFIESIAGKLTEAAETVHRYAEGDGARPMAGHQAE
ncbi:MAG: LysR family transcriptional regulator, nitrogen assimilation regulatory protein [Rhodospirillaceae bacterium]|nr:LysR family transcriptional regulator, nitrogen assimilation regulatory protein [Rhodospirillaceae bacterium]